MSDIYDNIHNTTTGQAVLAFAYLRSIASNVLRKLCFFFLAIEYKILF